MLNKAIVCINGNDLSRGYFSYINQVIRSLTSYEKKLLPIYIDFTDESSYSENKGDNIFEYFFEQPFIESLENYEIEEMAVWIDGIQFTSSIEVSDEDYELGRRIYKEFIRIKPKIETEFNELFEPHKDKKILGIHRRGTDYVLHGKTVPIEKVFESVDFYLKNYDALFLATEELSTFEAFNSRYPNLISLNAFRTNGEKSIFHLGYNKTKMAKEVLFDALFLSKCHTILKTASNVSDFAIFAGNSNYIKIQKEYTYK